MPHAAYFHFHTLLTCFLRRRYAFAMIFAAFAADFHYAAVIFPCFFAAFRRDFRFSRHCFRLLLFAAAATFSPPRCLLSPFPFIDDFHCRD